MDKTWKKFERDIAKELRDIGDIAERVPVTGRTRGSAPDVESLFFSIECKYRKSIPKWIKDGMDQAIASTSIMFKGDRMKTPILFIKEKGSSIGNTFVVFRLEDIKDLWESYK